MKDYSTKRYNWPDKMPDISVDRVQKLPVPLLVIGLGGTGAGIVNTVKTIFSERFYPATDKQDQELPDPPHTAYRLLDTDEHARGRLSSTEFVNLVIRGMRDILNPGMRDINLTSAENAWFDRRMDGGDYFWHHRQAIRFMLSRMYTQVYGTIKQALASIAAPLQADEQLGCIEIVICTGICGATGSGIFLDVPQIIRHIMATEPELAGKDYHMTGYIVMPDVSLRPVIGNPMADYLRMNAYASLKELDFWMQVRDHKTPYSMQYGDSVKVSWTQPPYDDCFLLSGEWTDGTVVPDVRTLQHAVAEHLFNYCASDYFFGYPLGCPDAVVHAGSAFTKSLPAYYGYSAIGICTARSPKRRILQLESKMLLESFLPPRDEKGCLLASDALCADGQTVARAKAIIGDVKKYFDAFAMTVKLPGICSITVADKHCIDAMRKMQFRPHDQENIELSDWVDYVAKYVAGTAADNYLAASWKRFEDFCASVMSEPELGPYALRDYLDHPDKGLIKELEAQVLSWKNLARKFKNDLTPLKQACTTTWPDFEHPPLLGRTKVIEAYLQNLNNYYSGLRKTGFMDAHARAAQMLLMRVNEYLTQSLKPMCADLKELYERAGSEPKTASLLEFDIVEAESIRQHISQAFAVGNADNRLTKRFLEDLYKESFKAMPDGRRESSGVTFLYRKEGLDALLRSLRNTLDEGFANINDWSIDQLLDQAADEMVKHPQELADHAIRKALAGAKPLFKQNDALQADDRPAQYTYLSVPDDSPVCCEQVNISGYGHVLRRSLLCDKFYGMIAWHALPLYRYRLMPELRKAYAKALWSPHVCQGLHLVWDGDFDSDYTRNWCRLPEPAPFYFSSAKGDTAEENAWKAVRTLTGRAIKCGMLEVDTSNICPSFRLHVFWGDEKRSKAVSALSLMDKVNNILCQKASPDIDKPLSLEQYRAMLEAFECQASTILLKPGKSSECMARYMELEGEDINPWGEEVAADPHRKSAAQHNHIKLSEALAAVILQQQPHLLLVVECQIDGWEKLARAKWDTGGTPASPTQRPMSR